MSTIRCAVIGTGHLGRIHAGLIRKIESETGRLKLVAVVDSDTARCETLAGQLRVVPANSVEQVCNQIDAAIIATPTVTHREVGRKLLSQGKHCFIEKPLALDMLQCRELIQLADEQNVTLQVGHVENFNPVWTGTRARLNDVRFVDAVRCGTYTGRSTDIGIVMDLMIHDLDLIAELVNSPVQRVSAFGMSVLSQREDFAEAHFHFQNGAIARVRASRIDEHMQRNMSVYGNGYSAHLNFADGSARLCNCDSTNCGNADVLPYDQRLKVKETLFTDWIPTEVQQFAAINAIEQELLDFADAVQLGTTPQVSGHRGLRAVTMAEQVLAAIECSKWQQGQHAEETSTPMSIPQYTHSQQRLAA